MNSPVDDPLLFSFPTSSRPLKKKTQRPARLVAMLATVLGLGLMFPAAAAQAQLLGFGSSSPPASMTRGATPYAALGPQPGSPGSAGKVQPHPAVARIIVPERDGTSYGSGTLVDARDQYGLVVTNWHVVRDAADRIEVVFPDGFRSFGQALKVDKEWDLAALVIWRPNISPVPLAAAAPQPGDALTIAGYGQGTYRAVTGRCTQYLSPTVRLPREMVEVSVAARQGDSGGPIFNAQGELAGVLWGAGSATTLGSYAGRVGGFLASVAPQMQSHNETQIAARLRDAPPLKTPLAGQMRNVASQATDGQSLAAAQATGSHTTASPTASQPLASHAGAGLVTVPTLNKSEIQPTESLAAKSAYADAIAAAEAQVDAAREAALMEAEAEYAAKRDRAALVEPTFRREFANQQERGLKGAALMATLSVGSSEPIDSAVEAASATEQPEVAEIPVTWQDIAGESYLDQAKTVFAAIGLFAVLHFFLRKTG